MLDILEKQLKSFNNKEIMLSAFLTLGIPIALSALVGSASLVTGTIAFPFLINGLLNKKVFSQGKTLNVLDSMTATQYKKIFSTWINEYLEKSDSLTEKKYKLLFVKMWLDSKNLGFNNFIGYKSEDKNEIFFKTVNEINSSGNTKYDIYRFLYNEHHDFLDYVDFINEDIKNDDKLKIAKEVYQDFKHLGLLGNNLRYLSIGAFPIISILQDYCFSEKDIEIISTDLKKYCNNKNNASLYTLHITDGDIYLIECFLEHSDQKTLKVFQNVLKTLPFKPISTLDNIDLPVIIDKMEKQIQYLQLDNALSLKQEKRTQSRKI